MKKYKPEYLGKVIPAEDKDKLTDFLTNKYESFSKIYDNCKDYSEEISDISLVEVEGKSCSIKVNALNETINNIRDSAIDMEITGDIFTAGI